MYGRPDEPTLEKATEIVRTMDGRWPVPVSGEAELASKFIWGVYAWGEQRGVGFPKEQRLPYTSLIAQPPGSSYWWAKELCDESLTPAGLVRASSMIYEASSNVEISGKMEIVCLSSVRFDVKSIDELTDALRNDSNCNEIAPGRFDITRPYPRNHWSPLAKLGGTQTIGGATIENGQLIVESKTLSMLAFIIGNIEKAAPNQITFHSGEWKTQEDLQGQVSR
jgi:hypothetical protein